jgi:hypothetical protein
MEFMNQQTISGPHLAPETMLHPLDMVVSGQDFPLD